MRFLITIIALHLFVQVSFAQKKTIFVGKVKIENGTYISNLLNYEYNTLKGKTKTKTTDIQLKCIVSNDSLYITQCETCEDKDALIMFYNDSLAISTNLENYLSPFLYTANNSGYSSISEDNKIEFEENYFTLYDLPFIYKFKQTVIKPREFTFMQETTFLVDKSTFTFTKISD